MSVIEISDLANKIEILPSLPSSFYKILEVLDNPNSSTNEIAGEVKKDQAITARVLKVINSAFYSLPSNISNVEQTVSLLGRNALKNLIITNSVLKSLGPSEETEGLWIHAFAVGTCAKKLGAKIKYREIEELFLCGLLHDIGKVVFLYYYPSQMEQISEKAKKEERYFHEVENEYFDVGHEIIGKMLLEKWNIPNRIGSIIASHHNPGENEEYPIETTIVHISDALVRHSKIGDTFDGNLAHDIPDENFKRIGVEKISISEWSKPVCEEMEKVKDIFLS